jgi:serine/threonine protein phosphatase PrpC
MNLILRTAAVSDRGKARENNEDALHAGPHVVAVADGVGGGPSGEVASGLVIRTLAALESAPPSEASAALQAALTEANLLIRAAINHDPSLEGMATTLTAMVVTDRGLAIGHIGDSRAYAWRGRALTQLTRDDTYVQGLVDSGIITLDEARRHPQRSLVTQALNGNQIAPTFAVVAPQPGDRFLLCSDGLSDYVDDQKIADALASYPDLQQCVEQLVGLALDAGAPDNVSVVLADVVSDPSDG